MIASPDPEPDGRTRLAIVPDPRSPLPGSHAARHDPRWPAIAAALTTLHEQGRFSIRIVDADCGAGSLLIHAAHHARAIGYSAIEARGIDGSPALIGRARASASRLADPAIGLSFDLADALSALREEEDMPADIMLWHGPRRADIDAALARAAVLVIRDHDDAPSGGDDR